jgi:uncharacterized protein
MLMYSKFAPRTSLLLALLLGGFGMLCAQSGPKYTMEAKGIYDGNNVVLRWAPGDFGTWNWANTHNGYNVERTTTRLNNAALTPQAMLDSRTVLATALKPLPEAQWETMPDSNMAGIVAGSIYGDSLEVIDLANADMMSVVNTTESRANRFGFSLFACDQNFDVATAAGLAFTDTSAVANAEYIYVVRLHTLPSGASQQKGTVIVSTASGGGLPAPPKPSADGGDKSALVTWDHLSMAQHYGSYAVERSSDGGQTYVKRNASAFVSLNGIGKNEEAPNVYLDSLPANGVTYLYRVRGLSPFGFWGAPSDTVRVQGRPAPLGEAPDVIQIKESVPGELRVVWDFPQNLEAQISGFEVYRAERIDGAYELLSTVLPTERELTDPDPLPSNYYIVKSKDINNNRAASLPSMGQPNDAVPPASPTGLSGSCDANGTVTVSWVSNSDDDLAGYRVFMSDQSGVDSAFVQITAQPVRDTFFRFQTNLNTLARQMYFRVKAVDFRENRSPSSLPLGVQRPDVVPPSPPAITRAYPRAEDVQLAISPSSSADVTRYEIEKQDESSPTWVKLDEFSAAALPALYTDSVSYQKAESRRRWYRYRVLAYDADDNVSSSQAVRTKPLDQGIREPVQDFTAEYVSPEPHVRLRWTYAPDMDLAGFQIYRAIDTSKMRSFKFISLATLGTSMTPNQYGYDDWDMELKTLLLKDAFTKPPAQPGGTFTTVVPVVVNKPLSTAPNASVTLRYQVMAVCFDGAQSPLSPEVQVVVQ